MAERDPRVTPKRGDVLRKTSFDCERHQEVEILGTSHGVVKFKNSSSGPMGAFFLQRWMKWAKTATVIRRAEPEDK